ncbi:hypothetical protein NGA_0111000 [Nannochloropsis gaditana CCMP526]|nr:hypothetical protein NGA_0111000 [Nannochloropsis gaditana CCMP526]EKU21142.1 hypothetical protein NGA_0111000 [Nannochloropsis gaditana CCMP526]|eukprot:XP_005855220.1 hypothetical protein NGA_0111000 [Nannochloropsis gaditana CCMP526]
MAKCRKRKIGCRQLFWQIPSLEASGRARSINRKSSCLS